MKNGTLFDKYCSTDPEVINAFDAEQAAQRDFGYETLGVDVFGAFIPLHEHGAEECLVAYVSEGDGEMQLNFVNDSEDRMTFDLRYMERIVQKARELEFNHANYSGKNYDSN